MKKKVIILVIVYILGIITPIIYNNTKRNILDSKVIYNIIIDREFINLREEVNLNSDIIRRVYKGEKFRVIKYYEGNIYNWYNVIYDDNKLGWIASDKEESWVIVENF